MEREQFIFNLNLQHRSESVKTVNQGKPIKQPFEQAHLDIHFRVPSQRSLPYPQIHSVSPYGCRIPRTALYQSFS